MRIFFDVDYTIQGDDGSLRPGVRATFERLCAEGHTVYVWSALGERWDDLRRHDLLGFVAGVYRKPLYNHHARLEEIGVPVVPDFVIDDSPDIVEAFGGTVVEAYTPYNLGGPETDLEMDRVLGMIRSITG